MRKTSEKSQLRDIPQNTLTVILQTVKVIKTKGKSEKFSQPKEGKEIIKLPNEM